MQTSAVKADSRDANLPILNLMKTINRFELFSEDELLGLIGLSRLRRCKPGDIVIQEGEYDCWVYFLLQGKLEIIKNGKNVCQLARNGDVFGEMGVVDGSPRSATIRAVDKSLILGIDASVIDRKLRTNEVGFCYIIYRIFAEVLAARLRDTTLENSQLKETLSRFGNPLLHT